MIPLFAAHRARRVGLLAITSLVVTCGVASAQIRLPDLPCSPPVERCPAGDAVCRGITSQLGNAIEPKTGRRFFLDYSCNLRPGTDAIFILNVHGIGSSANWQRHYFPAVDYKDAYNLILASGKSAGTNFTPEADDEYVRGMIDYVASSFPGVNITFWVAGHSAGGGYSRRWLCNDSALRGKAVGAISLAGNRIGGMGSNPGVAIAAARGRGAAGAAPAPGGGPGRGAVGSPPCGEFSHIYSTGDIDSLGGNPIPATSSHAVTLGCGERIRHTDIIDTIGGQVYDARDREPPMPGWGKEARPGTTEFFEFPNCRNGRVVADLIRLGKGHTEGLEPKVTEEIIKLVTRGSRRSQ